MLASDLEVPIDPYGWDLYRRKVGVDEAALAIGQELQKKLHSVQGVRASGSKHDRLEQAGRIRQEMHDFMSRYAKFGAMDMESKTVLTRVIGAHLDVRLDIQ
ncbi:hypothetical protein GCM10028796_13070 [Ramlibacter monticola]|uniref:Uncharacterized protein n=1 Tax=Ramlibacter monticola TaxID=1926872 RepID=A0A937CS78_9BURK|nr:hypothetical protein [Ramlibacter monticola]MBL0390153.1 hypothetical protein [Ramlibacter monticola]